MEREKREQQVVPEAPNGAGPLSGIWRGMKLHLACRRSTPSLKVAAELGGSGGVPAGRPAVDKGAAWWMPLRSEPGGEIWRQAACFLSSPFYPLSSSTVRRFVVSPTDPSLLVIGLCCAGVESSKNRDNPVSSFPPSLSPPWASCHSCIKPDRTGSFLGSGPVPFCLLFPPSPRDCGLLLPPHTPELTLSALVRTFWMAVR